MTKKNNLLWKKIFSIQAENLGPNLKFSLKKEEIYKLSWSTNELVCVTSVFND